jgi:hypothetical protein
LCAALKEGHCYTANSFAALEKGYWNSALSFTEGDCYTANLFFAAFKEGDHYIPNLFTALQECNWNSALPCSALNETDCYVANLFAVSQEGPFHSAISCASLNDSDSYMMISFVTLNNIYTAYVHNALRLIYSNIFETVISNKITTHAIKNLKTFLNFSRDQAYYISIKLFQFSYFLSHIIKVIIVNYGKWASVFTASAWNLINKYSYCKKSYFSDVLITARTLRQNIMLKHDYTAYTANLFFTLIVFDVISILHVLCMEQIYIKI